MNRRLRAFALAAIIGLLLVAAGLGLVFGLDNPVVWLLILLVIVVLVVYRRLAHSKQLAWKESYSVGVKVLDDDHKRLINLINQFETAYDYHVSTEFERTALSELVDYTRYHFKREEELLEANGYADLEEHKKLHQQMIATVEGFLSSYESQGHEALQAVVDYLKGWLIHHINGTDKQYGAFLNEKGIN